MEKQQNLSGDLRQQMKQLEDQVCIYASHILNASFSRVYMLVIRIFDGFSMDFQLSIRVNAHDRSLWQVEDAFAETRQLSEEFLERFEAFEHQAL